MLGPVSILSRRRAPQLVLQHWTQLLVAFVAGLLVAFLFRGQRECAAAEPFPGIAPHVRSHVAATPCPLAATAASQGVRGSDTQASVSTQVAVAAAVAIAPRSAWSAVHSAQESGLPRRCIVGSYDADWQWLAHELRNGTQGLVYVRYADGELAVLRGQEIGNQEWRFTSSMQRLRSDLISSLRGHYGQRYIYAFASPLDDAAGLRDFLQSTEQSCNYISYANMWVNSHFVKTEALLWELLRGRYAGRAVLIANAGVIQATLHDGKQPAWMLASYALEADMPPKWQDAAYRDAQLSAVRALAASVDNALFLISGGPPGKILIAAMWEANKSNRYIDFGSIIDPIFRGVRTRSYQEPGHPHALQVDPAWYVPRAEDALDTNPVSLNDV